MFKYKFILEDILKLNFVCVNGRSNYNATWNYYNTSGKFHYQSKWEMAPQVVGFLFEIQNSFWRALIMVFKTTYKMINEITKIQLRTRLILEWPMKTEKIGESSNYLS